MKTNPNDAVSAFMKEDEGWNPGHGPLTKREYFAAMAMQGCLSGEIQPDWDTDMLIKYSVVCADKLIAELNKEEK